MIVKAWGDWPLFQQLLGVLRSIGDRHGGASIANVATRWVLDHPFVGAVIIGEGSVTVCSLTPSDASLSLSLPTRRRETWDYGPCGRQPQGHESEIGRW